MNNKFEYLMIDSRLKSLLGKLKLSKIDGFLVSSEANVSYLSGFKNSDSYLLISPSESFFITDFRYTQEAKSSVKGFRIFQYKNLFQDIAAIAHRLKIRRLGFESKNLSFAEYSRIKSCLRHKVKLIDTFNIVENLRQAKDTHELGFIRKAIAITGETIKFLGRYLKPGQTELEVAGEIERFIRCQGAHASAFDIIVASGPNSSFPHASSGSRSLSRLDGVLVDVGVEVSGYKSDLTRVFFLDRISPIQRKIYGIVKDAQAQAIEVIRPGIQISKIHQAAAKHISKHGYSRYFRHSLGHGVGLEVHEDPSISSRNKSFIEEGMVFTVEPGIYLPGEFGIRLEDMVLVTKKGVEVLSVAIDKSI